jgi:GNAT superfamily N-acetyltransferase
VDLRALWVAMGEHLQTWFAPVRGFAGETGTGGFTALTGLPIPELNAIGIYENAGVFEVLQPAAERRTGSQHPALVLVSGGIAAAAERVTRRRGFVPGGISPFMQRSAEDLPMGITRFEVSEMGSGDVDAYAHAASEPFSLPAHVVRRFGAATLGGSGSRVYGLSDRHQVVSTVTVTGDGGPTGIWAMGTATSRQRRGYGAALLTEVMRRERERGASVFFLYSSEAGYPLYDRLGFTIVDAIALWVRLGVLDAHARRSPEPVQPRW